MKKVTTILSIMLICAFVFSLVGCSPNTNISGTSSVIITDDSSSDISSEFNSSEEIGSDEQSTSSEEQTSSGDEISSDISSESSSKNEVSGKPTSSNTSSATASSKPSSSSNSTSSKPSTSSNASSTTSKPNSSSTTSKPSSSSSTASKPSQNTSSTKPLSWKEKMESSGCVVLYDENVKLYYYYEGSTCVYESKYDGINTRRDKSFSNWDPTLKMYYEIIEGREMSWYDREKGEREDNTGHKLWNDKYYNGYWKVDYKLYTDGTAVLLKEYKYEEDTSILTCKECGKAFGNGTNGTCNYRYTLGHVICLYKCKICGTQFKGYTCHSCPEQYKSGLDRDSAIENLGRIN